MSIEKIPYFCGHIKESGEKCGKILRPFDVKMWEKTSELACGGLCLDCASDLETHIKITGAPELNEDVKKKILSAYEEIMKENEGKDFQAYK